MRIGLTYDLRDEYLAMGYSEEDTAEFDRASTVDSIESALRGLGHDVDRIGTGRSLAERLVSGSRWELVFNIAEGLFGAARESQVPCLLDIYRQPYTFSDPLVLAVTLHKTITKRVLRDLELPTPDFFEVQDGKDLDRIDLQFPVFAKPIAEGTGKGIDGSSVMANSRDLRRRCLSLLERFQQPVLVETYLPGREFTVGVLGTGRDASVLGTLEIVLLAGAEDGAYSYENKERCEELIEYRPVTPDTDDSVRQAESLALAAWRALGCRDGGRVDLRCDRSGAPLILELNPLAGLHPQHSDLCMIATARGWSYQQLIGVIVDSALRRAGRPSTALRS